MIKTIRCLECKFLFRFNPPKSSFGNKRYCPSCLLMHKEECLSHYKTEKRVGRPNIVEKLYGKDDYKLGWDEVNVLL